MTRKGAIRKREVIPDPVFNNTLVSKMVVYVMDRGRKSLAERIVYESIDSLKGKGEMEPIKFFEQAIGNVRPYVEVRPRRIGANKYDIVRIGMNSRLDTMQAAILIEKLRLFPKEIEQRQTISDKYHNVLKDLVETPHIINNVQSTWAQYTIKLPAGTNRELTQSKLKANGIPTAVHYPKPIHRQEPYKRYLTATPVLQNSDTVASTVLCLPMHPYLVFDESYKEKILSDLR